MADLLKEEQSELVKQHHRMASGAWVTGEELREKGSATMPEANSDHGALTNKGVDKRNA
jgi:hypothetical protein